MNRKHEKLLIALGLETLLNNALTDHKPKKKVKKVVRKKRMSRKARHMISVAMRKRWAKQKA